MDASPAKKAKMETNGKAVRIALYKNHNPGLDIAQDCGISSALAVELPKYCAKPSIYNINHLRAFLRKRNYVYIPFPGLPGETF